MTVTSRLPGIELSIKYWIPTEQMPWIYENVNGNIKNPFDGLCQWKFQGGKS